MIKTNAILQTNGLGLWTSVAAKVDLTHLTVNYITGELRAHFNKHTWDVHLNELIYTDELFIRELRYQLIDTHGFSSGAAGDIDYSEQGMQGDDYVSFDTGKKFLDEWFALVKS